MDRANLKTMVSSRVAQMEEEMWALALQIHENPEIPFQEFKSSQWLADKLASYGFAVQKPAGGLETAFSATWQSPAGAGPTIALLAEYDALPGLGHACGHNIIGTASVMAGIALSQVLSEVPATIKVIGTPAEEGGAGKVILLEQGVFDGVDVAMMTHPGSKTTLGGASLASTRLVFKFKGKPAHAASVPHEGINALDAVIATYNGINALRQHVPSHVRMHGIITHGGDAPNVVPEFCQAVFTIRSGVQEFQEALLEKVKNCARAGALSTGATLEIEQKRTYAVNRPNKQLQELFRENFAALGEPAEEVRGGGGSTDFGNISQAMPGLHPGVRICEKPVPGHSHEMREASRSAMGRRGLSISAQALSYTALDLLTQPEVLMAVKREFNTK